MWIYPLWYQWETALWDPCWREFELLPYYLSQISNELERTKRKRKDKNVRQCSPQKKKKEEEKEIEAFGAV